MEKPARTRSSYHAFFSQILAEPFGEEGCVATLKESHG
jgi:hypothetical protein